MNFARFLFVSAIALGSSTALAQTTTVDFDTFPGGAAVPSGASITTQYPGVVFSTVAATCFSSTYAAVSAPNSLRGNGPAGDTLRDIYMDFSPTVSRVVLNASDVGAGGLTVTAYAGAAAVDSQTIPPVPGVGTGRVVRVELSGVGITRVEATRDVAAGGDIFAIDDLVFDRTVVAVCGDGTQQAGEACDDGNNVGCDTCAADCSAVTTPGCLIGLMCIPSGTPNPGNACEVCLPATNAVGYSPVADGTACDDGLFCTGADSCTAGACGGTARDCSDALACTTDACDEAGDMCRSTVATGCVIGGMCIAAGTPDPMNPCMACNPSASTSAYTAIADGTMCDDGAFCTVSDMCTAGTCGGGARDCGDALTCTTDSCNELGDSCENDLQADACLIGGACIGENALDPGNQCLACNPSSNSGAYTNVMNGTACDDTLFCTDVDTCTEGVCGGSARDCSDGLSCTLDTCDDTTDMCNNELTAMSCTIDGACVADGAVDPTNPCMACNAAVSMAAYTPVADGTMCDDGAFCTEVDSCTAGACGGTMRACDDGLDCTADSCAEAAGECVNALSTGCLIDGACVDEDSLDGDNACQSCQSAVATDGYSALDDGTLCSEPTCMDRSITPASTCMTATCVPADAMPCPGGVACQDMNVCAGGCTMDAQCLADSYCNADGECTPDVDNGQTCDRANQCGSGFCASDEGVCCDASCDGLCEGCASGACTPHAAGTDPEGECGAEMCNGSGMCEMPAGMDAGPGMDTGPESDAGAEADAANGGSVAGGSCAAAPGAPAPWMPLVGLVGLGLFLRRRRR